MIWLGDKRGYASDWTTQRWIQITGRRVKLDDEDWLRGPSGSPWGIGPEFFDDLAAKTGLRIRRDGEPRGLLPDFSLLAADDFDPSLVHSQVRSFYERTSLYDFDIWSEWCGVFRPFGGLLALLFSRRLQQLNVPLSPLDTSLGITSEIEQFVQPGTGEVVYTAWVRQLVGSGNVLYAAAYSLCAIPSRAGLCVKVVFPLPNGNAIILMRPQAHDDGSFSVVSSGNGFGEPGFYFTVKADAGYVWARYLPSLKETIRVYESNESVRADHVLTLWGATFLRLHYRLRQTRHDAGMAAI
jgi:hypothetical protein